MDEFDNVIIGSGPGAPSLAIGLGARGQRTALIEVDQLGGTCVNNGCTPTKTLRKTARVAHLARTGAQYGVTTGPVEVDFNAAMDRVRDRIGVSRAGLRAMIDAAEGVEVIHGWGSLKGFAEDGRFVVGAGEGQILASRVFLNTGTRALVPPVPGLETVPYLDNASILELSEVPAHLIVVGGSYIGLEMGQIFRRLGAEVTIVHRSSKLANREDPDVSDAIADFLRAEGITVHFDSAIASVGRSMRGLLMTLEDGQEIAASHVLFATGRVPNTDRLGLDTVGVETDKRGYVVTDRMLRTNVPGIWAVGDINRRGAFTHTAVHDQQIILAELDGTTGLHQWQDADQRGTTYAMFTDPPLGRVGITLGQARALQSEGRNILVAETPMAGVNRAREESETTGLIRLIVDGDNEKILGATILGLFGDEVIAAVSNFMATGASYRVMQEALPVHPTVAEFLPATLGRLQPLRAEGEA